MVKLLTLKIAFTSTLVDYRIEHAHQRKLLLNHQMIQIKLKDHLHDHFSTSIQQTN